MWPKQRPKQTGESVSGCVNRGFPDRRHRCPLDFPNEKCLQPQSESFVEHLNSQESLIYLCKYPFQCINIQPCALFLLQSSVRDDRKHSAAVWKRLESLVGVFSQSEHASARPLRHTPAGRSVPPLKLLHCRESWVLKGRQGKFHHSIPQLRCVNIR